MRQKKRGKLKACPGATHFETLTVSDLSGSSDCYDVPRDTQAEEDIGPGQQSDATATPRIQRQSTTSQLHGEHGKRRLHQNPYEARHQRVGFIYTMAEKNQGGCKVAKLEQNEDRQSRHIHEMQVTAAGFRGE
jgi:hypothetical protein